MDSLHSHKQEDQTGNKQRDSTRPIDYPHAVVILSPWKTNGAKLVITREKLHTRTSRKRTFQNPSFRGD